MMNLFTASTFLCCVLTAVANAVPESADPDLTVTDLDRNLDMTSQLLKETTKLTIANGGKKPAKFIHFTVDPDLRQLVTFVEVTFGNAPSKTYLRLTRTEVKGPQEAPVSGWKVELKDPLNAGQSQTLEFKLTLGKVFKMFPSDIVQKERQLVLFTGNHYAFLPYKVKSQSTKVALYSSNIESYSKLKPVSKSDKSITYGPYLSVQPFSTNTMTVHFENNSPFLVITRLERNVELSMWGNIAITETLDVRHAGAKLKGTFSRLDYQREKSGVSSVNTFKTFLPASASDVYYRDDIGNISTSALKVLVDSVQLDLQPRFPLFGGWKTHYTVGYNVPSYEYLFNKDEDFVLSMRLLDHVFDDMLVEDFSLNVILPEGSSGLKMDTPYPVKRLPDSLHFTYLDTKGRPVISIGNVGEMCEKHIQDFNLKFKFSKMSMLMEPLLLVVAAFALFAVGMVYVRLDFSIVKDEGTETRLKVSGQCGKVAGHHDKRNGLYQAFENLLVALKANKDASEFQTNSKRVMADHKAETNAINDLDNALKDLSPDAHEKILELQHQDRAFRDLQTNQAGLVEKLVTGKLGKQVFIDQDAVIGKKKGECLDKMDAILFHLRSM